MIAWLMPPEMLPMAIRAKGNSISVSVNNVAGLVVAEVSPIALKAIGFKVGGQKERQPAVLGFC